MKNKITFYQRIKNYFEEQKVKAELKKEQEKQVIIEIITKPMSQSYINDYNNMLIANNPDNLSVNHNEFGIKKAILLNNLNLFSETEFTELYNSITDKSFKKIKE